MGFWNIKQKKAFSQILGKVNEELTGKQQLEY
jgi:hypothetical protein